jgi:hypothetical protein
MPWRRMRDWTCSTTFLNLISKWKSVVSFMPWLFYPLEKSYRRPLARMLGGSQSRRDVIEESLEPVGKKTCDCTDWDVETPRVYRYKIKTNKQTNSMVWVRERTIPTEQPSDRRFSAKWLPTFADKGCHVVSVTDPYGRSLGCLDRSRYFSIK